MEAEGVSRFIAEPTVARRATEDSLNRHAPFLREFFTEPEIVKIAGGFCRTAPD